MSTTTDKNRESFNLLADAIPPASAFVRVEVDTDIPTDDGLFSESEDERFLVATNAAVSGFVQSFGSDLLLEELQYQPEDDTKRLGDGFYESYLIREAVMAQTGRRFLHSSLRTDQQQLQYLMENAVQAHRVLDLSVGVRLTSMQVAALTHDMVWLEEKIIDGQKVLVPTLYLATVRQEHIQRDGSMLARSITLNADRLTNTGGVLADSQLAIKMNQGLQNRGVLRSGDMLSLNSGGSISNIGNISARNDLLIKSEKSISSGVGHIGAGGNAIIDAKDNISVFAGGIGVRGDAVVRAGKDILMTGNVFGGEAEMSSGYFKVYNSSYKASTLYVGGNLLFESGENTTLTGSNISVDGAAALNVGGNLNVGSYRAPAGSSWVEKRTYDHDMRKRVIEKIPKPSSKNGVAIMSATGRKYASSIHVGDSLSTNVANDLTLTGRSDVSSGSDASFVVGGAVQ